MDRLIWYEDVLARDDLSPQYRHLLQKRQVEARLGLLVTPEVRVTEPLIDFAIYKIAAKVMRGEVLLQTVESNLHMLASERPNK